MFTGLIQEIGRVRQVSPRGDGRDLTIAAPETARQLAVGASVAINGACLTVERLSGDAFTCHAGAETLRRTTLGGLRAGDGVNLEPALSAGAALGGHFVQGHVDGVTRLRTRRDEGTTTWLAFELPDELARYVAEKGSIAVDGVSLTVAELPPEAFAVAVIPHTLAHTTLGALGPGAAVNLEVDLLAKYVERMLSARGLIRAGLTEEYLRQQGF